MEELFAKYHLDDKVVAIGVSGGADSLALVLQAAEELAVFGRRVVALTVNHQLRPTSAKEAEYVAEVMRKYGIEHHILRWSHDKLNSGIEETARLARYRLLAKWCAENEVRVLMTAHHANDQAETFLMRLERGSGLEGLCGIREYSERDGLVLLRPFLARESEEMRRYLREKNIAWIEDESNADTAFLRGRLRQFLPELTAKTGITIARICNAVDNLQSAEDYIEQQLQQLLAQEIINDFGVVFRFKYTSYLSWHREMKFRVLARLCRRLYIPRSERVLQLITRLNTLPFKGATLGEKEILLCGDWIWVVPEQVSKGQKTRTGWKNFVLQYPDYDALKVPHKAKLAILQKMGMSDENL